MKKLVLGLAAAAVIAMVSAPAMAATEWNFGASLRYETFWTQVDAGKGTISDLQKGGAKLDSDGKLNWGTQGNSRIKMFMKSDSLEGYIELGYNFDTNTVTTREYWGKYKFGQMGFIQIGQAHQLFSTPGFSNQVWAGDIGMHGIGTSFRPPTPKIILGYGGFSFALAKYVDSVNPDGITADIDTFIPQLQAAYQYKADTWRFKVSGAFQHYKLNKFNYGGYDYSSKNIYSWLVAAEGQMDFGPLYVKANASAGQNWSNAEWNSVGSLSAAYGNQAKGMSNFGYKISNGKIKDTTSIMAAVIAGYRLTESLRFEGGFGWRYDDNDTWKSSSHIFNAYVQAVYTVAPGFTITPEIGYIDLGKNLALKGANRIDSGYIWYAGAKWQMDF